AGRCCAEPPLFRRNLPTGQRGGGAGAAAAGLVRLARQQLPPQRGNAAANRLPVPARRALAGGGDRRGPPLAPRLPRLARADLAPRLQAGEGLALTKRARAAAPRGLERPELSAFAARALGGPHPRRRDRLRARLGLPAADAGRRQP